MKYAIYGVNRVAKDFMYIFDELDIVLFLEDNVEEYNYCGRVVYNVTELNSLREQFDKIIICDFDKVDKVKTLEKYNMKYNSDFIFESDLFYLLDDNIINKEGKKCVVWGTGARAKALLNQCPELDVEFYIDTYNNGSFFGGRPVYSPKEVDNIEDYFVIIAVAKENEIIEKLSAYNMKLYEDYCNSQSYISVPSRLLKSTIFDKSCYEFQCDSMMNHCEVGIKGELHCCCISFLYFPIGCLNDKSYEQIWNSNIHKIMCLSTNNRTYTFCNKKMCPFFIGKDGNAEYKEHKYLKMDKKAKNIAISYDESCNLKCVTCRNEVRLLQGEALAERRYLKNIVENDIVPDAEFVTMSGSGEVFFAPLLRELYLGNSLNNTKWIRLLCNGTLFDEKRWEEFSENKQGKKILTVSIDAAYKESYESIRRNGNFDVLKKNMEFASRLRKSGELSYFRLNFVVQRNNYTEMIPFVEWGKELGVDEIFFTRVRNWGTYTRQEFKEISMFEEDDITPKAELIDILSQPIMKDPIVDLGTIIYSHKPVEETYIENYYKWELERKVPDLFEGQ